MFQAHHHRRRRGRHQVRHLNEKNILYEEEENMERVPVHHVKEDFCCQVFEKRIIQQCALIPRTTVCVNKCHKVKILYGQFWFCPYFSKRRWKMVALVLALQTYTLFFASPSFPYKVSRTVLSLPPLPPPTYHLGR